MAATGLRILGALALAYFAVLAALYLAQERFLFPAPQQQHQPAPGFLAVPLTTDDGLTLAAHWHAPDAGRPAAVFFHGNAGSLAGAAAETAQFAAAGYGLLLVEYRGYGDNPGAPSEAGFYRDGRAAMAFLAAQGVLPARTIVIGNSVGSGTATRMAQEFVPAALILSSPFTSFADVVAEQLPFVPARLMIRHQFDNLTAIKTLPMPILVLHGTADQVVPFAHGKTLAAASPRVTFRAFRGAGHELSFRPEAQEAQVAWLAGQGL